MRKSRNKLAKDKSIDVMVPLQFDKLGTQDDPCFGKLHDPKADECGSCGDSELCAIAQSQKLHFKRKEIEDKQDFKDLMNLECTWKDVAKCLRSILKIKSSAVPIPRLKTLVCKKLKIHESEFDTHLEKVRKNGKKLIFKSQEIAYKK
jgi:hypothetical protein